MPMKTNLEALPNKRLLKIHKRLTAKVQKSHRQVVFWTKLLKLLPSTIKPETFLSLVEEAARAARLRAHQAGEANRIRLNAVSRIIRQRKLKGLA